MTPAELAQQQLLAAWVSAGAAVVQACGAVAAIWFTGKLAREAADREIAARSASEAREREADAAAERRSKDADAAADRRISEAKSASEQREAKSVQRARVTALEERLAALRTVLQLGRTALLQLEQSEASWRNHGMSISPGRHLPETYQDTHTALVGLPIPGDDADAARALAALIRDTSLEPVSRGGTAKELADAFGAQAVKVEADLSLLESREEQTALALEEATAAFTEAAHERQQPEA